VFKIKFLKRCRIHRIEVDNMNEVLKAIANRRSIRKFKDAQIKEDELNAIIEAGLSAPSGHNTQPWYFTVIQDKAAMKEISEGSKAEMKKNSNPWVKQTGNNETFNIFYNAPTAIIVSVRKDAVTGDADISAATQNMLIAAESLGIGSCWIGLARFYFENPTSYKRLSIPEGYEAKFGVVFGYKPEGFVGKAPERKYKRYWERVV
jgi:nitroreductase